MPAYALPLLQVAGPIFDVAQYGCTPQPPASRTGFCDAAFRAAIQAAESAGGGVVYFPPGSYILGNPATVCPAVVF
jgi:polygalacturonase